jgi:hypothetical protein
MGTEEERTLFFGQTFFSKGKVLGCEAKKMGDKIGIRIGIATAVIAIAMLAVVPGASAFAVDTVGTIQFENGTTCPYGWTVCEENLNETYGAEPWCEPSSYNPPFWDYLVVGRAATDESYIRVWVTSLDGKWYGENISKIVDVKDEMTGFYWVNLVVHEVAVSTESKLVPMATGWNLISLCFEPADSSTSAVLSSISGKYDVVKKWDTSSHSFVDATTMDRGNGYFVYVNTACTWNHTGTNATGSMDIPLKTGLNLVGYPFNRDKNTGDTLSGLSYYYATPFNTTAQKYDETYIPAAPAQFNDFQTIEPCTGFWISAKSDQTWTVS